MFRSLYSVLPASVRDNKKLRPSAKLLYCEISALCQSEGYCWATNKYLSELFGMSVKTVESLIKQLDDEGHIIREIVRDTKTHEVISRKIWISDTPGTLRTNGEPKQADPDEEKDEENHKEEVRTPPLKNEDTPPLKNEYTPPLKNEGSNNIRFNNINTPQSPPRGTKSKRQKKAHKETADWKPERFEGFWEYYPIKKSRSKAIIAWDKLKPSDELIVTMGRALRKMFQLDEQWAVGIGIPYPATWLNQERWNDQPKITGQNNMSKNTDVAATVEDKEVYIID